MADIKAGYDKLLNQIFSDEDMHVTPAVGIDEMDYHIIGTALHWLNLSWDQFKDKMGDTIDGAAKRLEDPVLEFGAKLSLLRLISKWDDLDGSLDNEPAPVVDSK